MAVAKVIELIAEGDSIEAAVQDALKEAKKSIKGIRSIYLQDTQAVVRDGAIKHYRVNCKVTFIVGD